MEGEKLESELEYLVPFLVGPYKWLLKALKYYKRKGYDDIDEIIAELEQFMEQLPAIKEELKGSPWVEKLG